MRDEDLNDIGILVAEAASELFNDCGASDDFCIQHVGQRAVFGGRNRVIFDPIKGFFLDVNYCTDQFIAKFDRIIGIKKG